MALEAVPADSFVWLEIGGAVIPHLSYPRADPAHDNPTALAAWAGDGFGRSSHARGDQMLPYGS